MVKYSNVNNAHTNRIYHIYICVYIYIYKYIIVVYLPLPSQVIVTNPLLSMITLPSSSRLNQPCIFAARMTLWSRWLYNLETRPVHRGRQSHAFLHINPNQIGKSPSSPRDAVSYFRALFRYTFCTSDMLWYFGCRKCKKVQRLQIYAVNSRRRVHTTSKGSTRTYM